MKKLMIALAVAACAVAVNAASFTWSATGTNTAKTFYGVDGNTIAGMTVYLLDAATVSQDALLTALRGGGAISDYTAVGSQALDGNSRIVSTQVSYGEAPNAYTFYMAIVDGDNLFLSAGVSSTAQASSVSAINFSGVKAATILNFISTKYKETLHCFQNIPIS